MKRFWKIDYDKLNEVDKITRSLIVEIVKTANKSYNEHGADFEKMLDTKEGRFIVGEIESIGYKFPGIIK